MIYTCIHNCLSLLCTEVPVRQRSCILHRPSPLLLDSKTKTNKDQILDKAHLLRLPLEPEG